MSTTTTPTTTPTTLTGCQRDVLHALLIGGRILWRSGCRPTLHDPKTGEYVANFHPTTLSSLLERGLIEGSASRRRRALGLIALTGAGEELALSLARSY